MSNEDAYRRTMDRLVDGVWSRHEFETLPSVFTADAVMHDGGPDDRGGHDMFGIAEFREGYLRPTLTAFPDLQRQIKVLLFDGNKVVQRFYAERTHEREFLGVAPTHKVVRYEGIAICRMEGELIAEVWLHSSLATVMAGSAQ